MPLWLEYAPRDTFLHHLHPFSKVAMMGTLLVLASLYWDLMLLLPLAIIGFIIALMTRVPRTWFLSVGGLMLAFLPITLIGIFTQVNPDLFRVYPREFVSSISFTFEVPPLGKFGITWGGILWGVANEVRVPIILLLAYSFIYSTSFNDLVQALAKARFPTSLVFVLMVAYKFIPEMWRQVLTIVTALRLRGWELRSRNPVKIARRASPLAFSLVRQVTVTIDEVNIATKIRAFGAGRISPTKEMKMAMKDKALMMVSLAWLIFALYLLAVYDIGMI